MRCLASRPRQHKLRRLVILGLETWLLVEIVRRQGRILLRRNQASMRRGGVGQIRQAQPNAGMGPCIAVGEADPTNVDLETFVNGERRQRFNTRDMVFSFGEYLDARKSVRTGLAAGGSRIRTCMGRFSVK